jgi:uncharacterized Zn-binding protein involved in type VI secretion
MREAPADERLQQGDQQPEQPAVREFAAEAEQQQGHRAEHEQQPAPGREAGASYDAAEAAYDPEGAAQHVYTQQQVLYSGEGGASYAAQYEEHGGQWGGTDEGQYQQYQPHGAQEWGAYPAGEQRQLAAEGGDYAAGSEQYAGDGGAYAAEGGAHFAADGAGYAAENGQYAAEDGQYAVDDGQYMVEGGQYAAEGGQYAAEDGQYATEGGQYAVGDGQYAVEGDQYVAEGSQYAAEDGQYAAEGGQYAAEGSDPSAHYQHGDEGLYQQYAENEGQAYVAGGGDGPAYNPGHIGAGQHASYEEVRLWLWVCLSNRVLL